MRIGGEREGRESREAGEDRERRRIEGRRSKRRREERKGRQGGRGRKGWSNLSSHCQTLATSLPTGSGNRSPPKTMALHPLHKILRAPMSSHKHTRII